MAKSGGDLSAYWVPDRTREFELKIEDVDLTNDVYKITILTSVDVPYQTFIIELFLDPTDVILEKIYGQNPIKFKTMLYAETSPHVPKEVIETELMYVDGNHPMVMLVQNPETTQKDRQSITITAVPKDAFKTMTTFVNDIFQGNKIENAITDIVNTTGATLKYDNNGKNTEVIDQIIIPPATLYQCLKYINRTWGIFNGPPAIYCLYDNTIYLKNMSLKMKTSHKLTVWQLALDAKTSDIISQTEGETTFYTIHDLNTKYRGNSVFSVLAPTMKHIVKPRDRLSHTIEINLEQFSKQYGLIAKSDKIFFDKTSLTSGRVSIYKDHTGYELTQSFINANYSKDIANITDMQVIIEQSFKLKDLMEVGEGVQVRSQVSTAEPLVGKYILRGTEMSFTKAKDWESSAKLFLIRTNRAVN